MEGRDGQVLIPTAGSVRPGGEASEEKISGAEHGGQAPVRRSLRREFSEETWALAEADYLAGATAVEVGARYGMAPRSMHRRMRGRGKLARAKAEKTAPQELLPMSEEEVSRLIREVVAEGYAGAAEMLRGRPVAADTLKLKGGRSVIRFRHSEDMWRQARRDYEAGGYTSAAIAERYRVKQMTVESRAYREGWSKKVLRPVRPLKAPDDPAQVETGEDGETKSKWLTIAHPAQLPPELAPNGRAWRTWLFQGGRGAGKTRAGAEWLAGLAEDTPNGVFAIVGATENDVRRVMIEGPSGLMNLPGREWPRYEPSLKKLRWSNGAIAHVFSAEEPNRLRGPQFMAAWADEFAAWRKAEYTLAMLRMGLRVKSPEFKSDPRLMITTTPRAIAALRKLHAQGSCAVTRAPTSDNAANLHEDFLVGLGDIYGGTRLEQQELMGELLDGEGALWRREWIVREARPATFDRVVVAVDPPASMGGVCGIVVAGLLGTRGFVLEDASLVGASPGGWAGRVAEAARRHGAARIVVETNQGGDMVRTVLAMEAPPCPISEVRAHLAKKARAEPVAALYEKGRIVHCGAFSALEEEMMALGSEEETRLDRVDALVWALTDLLLTKRPMPGMFAA